MDSVIRTGAPVDAHELAQLQQNEALELAKRVIGRDLTDTEFELAMYTARRLGLDPLARQIHAVKRRGQLTLQIGIDGYRALAERTGKYAGQLGPYWCGDDGQWRDVWLSSKPPAAAKVGVLRTDFREPIWAVARYASYVQYDKDGALTPTWARMPDIMLAKCAEALALRKAFPQVLSGVYVEEEMGQADDDTHRTQTPRENPTNATQVRATLTDERKPKTIGEMLEAGGDDAIAAKRALAAVHAHLTDLGVDVTDRDWVHRIASEELQRDVQSLRDLTLDEMRELYRRIDRRIGVNAHTVSAPPPASEQPKPKKSKSEWHAWVDQHRQHIVLGPIADAIERRHVDVGDLCGYIYGTPVPTSDEQSQTIIEDLATRWTQYVASYLSQSQSQEDV